MRNSQPDRGGPTSAERLAAVAAASRAGSSMTEAWAEWDQSPIEVDAAGAPSLAGAPVRVAREAQVVGRLAFASGVPLADLVDALAQVEAAREESAAAREVAAAGARASARVLAWLPLAGMLLATAVEPRTATVMMATPFGWALLALGAGLTIAGRAWMRALVAAAQKDEVP